MLGHTHGLDCLLELLLNGLHLLLLGTIDHNSSLRERCGIEHLGNHLELTVLTHLTGKLVLIPDLEFVDRCSRMQVDLRQTVLGRVDKRVVHAIHKTEVETGDRLALIGNHQVDNIVLDLSDGCLDVDQNAIDLLRDPHCKCLLDAVMIDLNGKIGRAHV